MKTQNALRLHVPEPTGRPGERTDFSYLKLESAGSVPKPDVNTAARNLSDFAYRFIRVLDDEHNAVGPWVPNISHDALINGLKVMVTTRAFDARMLTAQRQRKMSFYMQSLGEEAVGTAQAMALNPTDMVFPSY